MSRGHSPQLVICSKSTWTPAIRREQALALEASRDGAEVTFLERPLDLRSLLSSANRGRWIRAALRQGSERRPAPGVCVRRRSTFVPAHRSAVALLIDGALLERSLREVPGVCEATVVATLPWHWPAVARAPARHRVLDYSDDWEALIPGAEASLRQLLERAEREADAITVVSRDLQRVFPHRSVAVVRNGTGRDVLEPPMKSLPNSSRIVYLGTFSDRFDSSLMADLLTRLPRSWTIELYGPCQYPRSGDQPSEEFRSLLRNARVTWHGPIGRDRVAEVLDRADVVVLPHRRTKLGSRYGHPSWRGDSMKLYDYAARGRPVVSTNWADGLAETGPPELQLVDDSRGFAAAIERAARTSEDALAAQRAWASERSWMLRWEAWKVATGFPVDAGRTRTDRAR